MPRFVSAQPCLSQIDSNVLSQQSLVKLVITDLSTDDWILSRDDDGHFIQVSADASRWKMESFKTSIQQHFLLKWAQTKAPFTWNGFQRVISCLKLKIRVPTGTWAIECRVNLSNECSWTRSSSIRYRVLHDVDECVHRTLKRIQSFRTVVATHVGWKSLSWWRLLSQTGWRNWSLLVIRW